MGKKLIFDPMGGKLHLIDLTTPGGADTQIQFNDDGAFGGSANLTFDKVENYFNTNFTSGTVRTNLYTGAVTMTGLGTIYGGGVWTSDSSDDSFSAVGVFDLSPFSLPDKTSSIINYDGEGNFTNFVVYEDVIQAQTIENKLSLAETSGITLTGSASLSDSIILEDSSCDGRLTLSSAKWQFSGSTTSNAVINIPDGDVPSSPVAGDIWANSGDLYWHDGVSGIKLNDSSYPVSDKDFNIMNDEDNSKIANFRLHLISSSKKRRIEIPDRDIQLDEIKDGVTETTIPDHTLLTSKGDGTITGYANGLEYFDSSTIDANLRVRVDSIGTSVTNNLSLVNGASSTSDLNQYSPALMFQGQGWIGGSDTSYYHYIRAYNNDDHSYLSFYDTDGGYTMAHRDKELRLKTDSGIYFTDSLLSDTDGDMRIIHDDSNSRFAFSIRETGSYVDKVLISDEGDITQTGSIKAIATKTSNYTLTTGDYTILADGDDNTVTITLPASPETGRIYNIKCINDDFTVTVDRNGNNIDGAANDKTLSLNESITLQADSSGNWWIL